MSRTVTVAGLMVQARQRADMPGEDLVVDVGELDEYAMQSWTALYDMLVQTNDHFFTKAVALNILGGVATYNVNTVAADFYKLDGIDIPVSGSFKYTAERCEFGERNDYSYPFPGYAAGLPSRFALVGNLLTFYPTPSASAAATMWYTPAPPPLGVATSTALDGYAGWEEWVVLDMAIKMLVKEDQLQKVQLLEAQKALVTQRILTMARRDVSGPSKVTRRRYRRGMWPFRWGY